MTVETELAKKLGIKDFAAIDTKQANKILDKVREGKISEAEYAKLLDLVPEFAKISVKYLEALVAVAKGAGSSQKLALTGVSKAIDALNVLASNAQSDATKENIARIFLEISHIISDMNKANNQFWAGLAIAGVSAVVITGVITGRISIGQAADIIIDQA